MWHFLILLAILICAFQAVLSKRLLVTAMWLAGTSALVALLMYLMGAYQIAVIELSVGAGLVTVLFVFAINIAGEEPIPFVSIVPKPIAWFAVLAMVGILVWQILPEEIFKNSLQTAADSGFRYTVWFGRQIDLYLQIMIIFAGVLSMLGLISEERIRHDSSTKEQG